MKNKITHFVRSIFFKIKDENIKKQTPEEIQSMLAREKGRKLLEELKRKGPKSGSPDTITVHFSFKHKI